MLGICPNEGFGLTPSPPSGTALLAVPGAANPPVGKHFAGALVTKHGDVPPFQKTVSLVSSMVLKLFKFCCTNGVLYLPIPALTAVLWLPKTS